MIDINSDKNVNHFIKNKLEVRDFAMAYTEMNKEHYHIGGDVEKIFMHMIYKMQIIIFKNVQRI